MMMHQEDMALVVDAIIDAGGQWPTEAECAETAGDRAARMSGHTRRIYIEGGCMGGEFLIKPDTDLDDRYRAWGVDWQEWTWVNGWNVLVEEVTA